MDKNEKETVTKHEPKPVKKNNDGLPAGAEISTEDAMRIERARKKKAAE